MTRFHLELGRIDDAAKRVLTEGLIKYAMGFYLIMRSQDIENYHEVVDKIGEYFFFMDDKYYNELEGSPDDMKQLATLLDKKDIVDHKCLI